MPTILLVIVVRLIVTVVSALSNRRDTAKNKSSCNECAFAHIQYSVCGRRVVSCTFGGGVRVMNMDVLYCTDYRPRSAPQRPAIGFVHQIAPAE